MENPNENPYLGQSPSDLYKTLKDESLTTGQVQQIESAAFPDGIDGIDFEDDQNAAKMLGRIQQAKRNAADREDAARTAALEAGRATARKYLEEQSVDHSILPGYVLDEVANSLRLQAEQTENPDGGEPVVVLARDDETMTVATESGVVVGFIDAPLANLERRNILEWVGERLARAQARERGLAAEKQFWLDKISKIYDPQINKQRRIQDSLDWAYAPMGQLYLDDIREQAAAKELTLPKSVKVGLLTLAYAADRARIEIVCESDAVSWLESNFPEAVKVKKEIGKSLLTAEVKRQLTEDQATVTGLYAYPGGTPQFSMK